VEKKVLILEKEWSLGEKKCSSAEQRAIFVGEKAWIPCKIGGPLAYRASAIVGFNANG
jgi:hypothetical protein